MSDPVDNNTIFSAMAQEASGLYDLIIKIASLFLGGTLLFIEKITPHPSACSVHLLGIGWLLLIITIVLIAIIRLINIKSGNHAMGSEMDHAKALDRIGLPLTYVALSSFALGLILIASVGLVNIPINDNCRMEKCMNNEEPKNEDGIKKRGSLPFGNTKPEPKPAEPKTDTTQGK